jgi:LacI family transcriptional regulator
VDNDAGGYLALQHLHQLGHRKVAVILGPEEMFDSQPRREGVQRYATEASLTLNPELMCQLPSQVNPYSAYDNGILLTERMLAKKQEFSAILAFDDLTALGVIRGLLQSGLRVPKDCSVIGFDDVSPVAVSLPSVTTIRQPMLQIGETAAKCVMVALKAKEDGRRSPVQVHTLPPTLIARESTAPYRVQTGSKGASGKA